MPRTKTILLAVLAMLCINLVATVAASASEGEFVNSKGEALVKNKFTATSAEAVLETAAKTKIVCKTSTAHGILTSRTGGEVTVLFHGCTASGLSCKGGEDAAGKALAGEVIVLFGLLVKSISGSARLPLLTILRTATKEAGEFEFECTGVKIKVKGSVLTSNSFLVGALSGKYTLEVIGKNGEQTATEYQNEKGEKVKCKGLEASIEGGAFEKSGITVLFTEKFEEEGKFE